MEHVATNTRSRKYAISSEEATVAEKGQLSVSKIAPNHRGSWVCQWKQFLADFFKNLRIIF